MTLAVAAIRSILLLTMIVSILLLHLPPVHKANAQCDMWQPPLLVPSQSLQTSFSMIMSPFGTYFNDQGCHWLLQCPTGYHIYLFIQVVTAERADNFTLYGDENKKDTLSVLFGGSGQYPATLSNFYPGRDHVYLTFFSNGKNAARGFSGAPYFKCYVSTCSKNATQNPIVYSRTTTGSLGFSTALPNEACVYEFHCPSNYWLYFRGTLETPGLVVSTLDGVQLNASEAVSFIPQNFTSVRVEYNHTASSEAFLFLVECQEPAGSCPPHEYINDPKRTITVPRLANGGQSYLNLFNCSWTIECPGPDLWISISGSLKLSEDLGGPGIERFEIFDETNNKTLKWKSALEYEKFTGKFYPRQQSIGTRLLYSKRLQVYFSAGVATERTSNFVAMSFKCWASNCTTSNSTQPMKVVSNFTEETFKSHFPQEECDWEISCTNSSAQMVFYNYRGDAFTAARTPQSFWIYNSSGAELTMQERASFSNSWYRIRYKQWGNALSFTFLCMMPIGDICKETYNHSYYSGVLDFPKTIFNEYYGGVRCVWDIACPFATGGAVVMYLDMFTHNEMDNFTVYSKNPTTGFLTELATYSGFDSDGRQAFPIPIEQMFRVPNIVIVFSSDYIGAGPGVQGQFQYRCFKHPCHTNTSDTIALSYNGVAPPTGDDAHKVTVNSVIPGEKCTYTLQCADTDLEIYWITASFSISTMTMAYLHNGSLVPNTALPKATWLDYVYGYKVEYEGRYASLPDTTNRGAGAFSFEFECIDRETTDFCKGNEMTVNATGPYTLLGHPLHRKSYLDDMDCKWWVHCPDNMNVAVLGSIAVVTSGFSSTGIPEGDFVRIYAPDGVSLLHQVYHDDNRAYDARHIFRNDTLLITFTTDRSGKAAGFFPQFGFQCFVGNCSSNTTEAQAMTHTLGGPPFTVASNYYYEDCDYTMTCDNPVGWIAWDGDSGDIRKRFLSMYVKDTVPRVAVPLPQASSMQPAKPLKLEYRSNMIEAEWRFRWACFFSDQFEGSACGFRALQLLDDPQPTSVSMPINPFGKYYNQVLCNWAIECPSDMNVALWGTVITPAETDYLVVMDVNETYEISRHYGTVVVDKLGSPQLVTSPFAYLLRVDQIRLRFESDDKETLSGFSPLKYMCIVGNCTSNTTDPRQVIYSGGGPLTMGNTFDFEDCEWVLKCANPLLWMTFGFFKGVTDETVEMLDVDGDFMPTPDVSDMIPMNYLKIQYRHPPGQSHRFQINFMCFAPFVGSACAPGATRLFIGSRGIFTLPSLPNDKYGTNLVCTWEIRCPFDTGGVELWGSISTHAPTDNFTIYNGSLTNSSEEWTPPNVYRVHYTNTSRSPPDAWRYMMHTRLVTAQFMSNATGGAKGLLTPFWYLCHTDFCSSFQTSSPVMHYPGSPPINISVETDYEECVWEIGCGAPGYCLVIVDISKNLTGVGFKTTKDGEILYDEVTPIVIPVSALRVTYASPWPGHSFYVAFQCVSEPQPKFCPTINNEQVRRLWNSFTWAQTFSATKLDTATPSISSTITSTASLGVPATSTATASSMSLTTSKTVLATSSETFSETPFSSISTSLDPSRTLTVTGSSSLTLSDTVTATETGSTSFTDSNNMIIRLSISPSVLYARALRGERFGSDSTNPDDLVDPTPADRSFTLVPIGAIFNVFHKDLAQMVFDSAEWIVRSSHKDGSLDAFGFSHRKPQLLFPTSIRIDAMTLNVTFSRDAKFFLEADENVEVRLPASVFVGGELGAKIYPANFTIKDDMPTRHPTTIETVTGVGALVTSMVSPNPAVASQAGRIVMIARLSSCSFPVDEALPGISYPIGIPITDSPYRFYIGAMLLNPASLLLILLLHAVVAAIVACIKNLSFVDGLVKVYCPSYFMPFLLFFCQESISALFTVLLHEIALLYKCIAMLLFVSFPWGVIFGSIAYFLLHQSKLFLSWYEKAPNRGCIARFFLGDGDWEDAPLSPERSKGFTQMYGQIFVAYRESRRWFILVEFFVNVAMGVAQAIRPPAGNCTILTWVVFGPMLLLYTLLVLILSPYASLFEQFLSSGIAFAECLAVFFIAYSTTAYEPGPERDEWLQYSAITMMVVEYSLLGKLALDLTLLGIEVTCNAFSAQLKENEQQGGRSSSSSNKGVNTKKGKRSLLSSGSHRHQSSRHRGGPSSTSPLSGSSSDHHTTGIDIDDAYTPNSLGGDARLLNVPLLAKRGDAHHWGDTKRNPIQQQLVVQGGTQQQGREREGHSGDVEHPQHKKEHHVSAVHNNNVDDDENSDIDLVEVLYGSKGGGGATSHHHPQSPNHSSGFTEKEIEIAIAHGVDVIHRNRLGLPGRPPSNAAPTPGPFGGSSSGGPSMLSMQLKKVVDAVSPPSGTPKGSVSNSKDPDPYEML